MGVDWEEFRTLVSLGEEIPPKLVMASQCRLKEQGETSTEASYTRLVMSDGANNGKLGTMVYN